MIPGRITPHPHVTIIFLIAFAFLYYNGQPVLFDTDAPWHLKAGKEILTLGEIPETNSWSYGVENVKWYNISWLFDVALSVVANAIGLQAVYTLTVLLMALSLAVLTHILIKRNEASEDPISITLFLVGLVLWHSLYSRPQLITYIIVPLFAYCLHRSRDSSNASKALYFYLPSMMVLWVNIHGGFLIGFTILGAYLIEALADKKYIWLKQIIIAGALCALATIINPYGLNIIDATLRTLDSSITNYIAEWQLFQYGAYLGMSIFFLSFVFVSNFKENTTPLADKILTGGWFIAAMLAIRNFSIFALLASPFVAICLQKTITLKKNQIEDSQKNRRVLFITAIFIVAIYIAPVTQSKLNIRNVVYAENKTPIQAIKYIEENYAERRFINDYGLGGYISYLGNNIQVFSDGRAGTAYPEERLEEVITFHTRESSWETIAEKYNITGAIVLADKGLEGFPNWKKVFESQGAHVYIKLDDVNQITQSQP